MTDKIDHERRSWNMSRIKSANTKPEKYIRSILHKAGLDIDVNGRVSKKNNPKGKLPGKPDIVLKKISNRNICAWMYWHRHEDCKDTTTPKTRT